MIAAAVILGGSLVGGSYLIAGSIDRGSAELGSLRSAIQTAAAAPAAAPSPSRSRRPDPNKVYQVAVAGAPTKGPKSAAITLIEWSDFQ
jgi:hypothetical protein